MVRLNYPYLISDRDRYGTTRYYVRRFGRKVRIRATPGTEAFVGAYHDALSSRPHLWARLAGWRHPISRRRNFLGSRLDRRPRVDWSWRSVSGNRASRAPAT